MPTPRALNTRYGLSVGTKSVIDANGILIDVGNLTSLTTTSKTSIVSAINEVKGNFTNITTADLSQFAPTTSAQLAALITDETGTGLLVFSTSPSLTTPSLGVATATSINKVAITAPATGSTLTIADGKTLTVSNTLTFTGTDASSVAFGTGGTVVYTGSNNPFTGANTFTNATGQIFRQAATQDGILLRGRAGGTSGYTVELIPTTLTASRTLTAPDVSGTLVTTGDTGTITSAMIANGTVVDADISTTAEIAVSKLANGTARQIVQTAANGTDVEWTSNIDVPGTLDVTGNAVFDARVTVNGIDVTESARDVEEARLIRRNGTATIGLPGTVPFGVGPMIPPGMSLVGIGPDSYNVIDVYSGSVC